MMNIIKPGTIYHFFRKARIAKLPGWFCRNERRAPAAQPFSTPEKAAVK